MRRFYPLFASPLLALTVHFYAAAQSDLVRNIAEEGLAAGSSYSAAQPARRVNDGAIGGDSFWETAKSWGQWEVNSGSRGQWLEISWPFSRAIGSIQLYSGAEDRAPVRRFQCEYQDAGGEWRPVPGATADNNTAAAVRFVLKQPVITSRLRVVIRDDGNTHLQEVAVFPPVIFGAAPPLIFDKQGRRQPDSTRFISTPDSGRHHVLVNQTGYTLGWPMRFTAPLSPDGSTFRIREATGGEVVYTGTVADHIGDFSDFKPSEENSGYLIDVNGKGLDTGRSFCFRVAPRFFQEMALGPALHFMTDARSYIGTHPSAYGGNPWRDGTYYTYELPSLVLMYMANPAWFGQAPREIDYQADKRRILDPSFWYTNEPSDSGAIDGARRYYQELDAPVGDQVPDLVQMLHWGIGYFLMHPHTRDNSERINGKHTGYMLHGETLEQFAYFLYAFPSYSRYFTEGFYNRARDFAFDNWERTGLLKVNKRIGDYKGRQCPGHTIAPNLMMYQVARRERRADAEKYLDAAIAQTNWLVNEIDPADPAVTKGQRMSEHKLATGLFFLRRLHPENNVKGLDEWIASWTDVMLSRSRNMYDYRRYSDDSWTIPAGSVKWNDPGSVAGFPGIAVAMSTLNTDKEENIRLQVLKASHVDHLFGRNPLNACATQHIEDFEGAEIRWPKFDRWDVCARIELTRGAICSVPGHEQFPFNPASPVFRHPEGWTTFNSALNVSLAYLCWDDTELSAEKTAEGLKVRLQLPFPGTSTGAGASPDERQVNVQLRDGTRTGTLILTETAPGSGRFEGIVSHGNWHQALSRQSGNPNKNATSNPNRNKNGLAQNTAELEISYGYGPFRQVIQLPSVR